MSIVCFKCGVAFRVAQPQTKRAEWSRCVCGRFHWSVQAGLEPNCYGVPAKTVVVGVDPATVETA